MILRSIGRRTKDERISSQAQPNKATPFVPPPPYSVIVAGHAYLGVDGLGEIRPAGGDLVVIHARGQRPLRLPPLVA